MYEYRIVSVLRDKITDALAEADGEGWELVTATWDTRTTEEPAEDTMHLFFRKQNEYRL